MPVWKELRPAYFTNGEVAQWYFVTRRKRDYAVTDYRYIASLFDVEPTQENADMLSNAASKRVATYEEHTAAAIEYGKRFS